MKWFLGLKPKRDDIIAEDIRLLLLVMLPSVRILRHTRLVNMIILFLDEGSSHEEYANKDCEVSS